MESNTEAVDGVLHLALNAPIKTCSRIQHPRRSILLIIYELCNLNGIIYTFVFQLYVFQGLSENSRYFWSFYPLLIKEKCIESFFQGTLCLVVDLVPVPDARQVIKSRHTGGQTAVA